MITALVVLIVALGALVVLICWVQSLPDGRVIEAEGLIIEPRADYWAAWDDRLALTSHAAVLKTIDPAIIEAMYDPSKNCPVTSLAHDWVGRADPVEIETWGNGVIRQLQHTWYCRDCPATTDSLVLAAAARRARVAHVRYDQGGPVR